MSEPQYRSVKIRDILTSLDLMTTEQIAKAPRPVLYGQGDFHSTPLAYAYDYDTALGQSCWGIKIGAREIRVVIGFTKVELDHDSDRSLRTYGMFRVLEIELTCPFCGKTQEGFDKVFPHRLERSALALLRVEGTEDVWECQMCHERFLLPPQVIKDMLVEG